MSDVSLPLTLGSAMWLALVVEVWEGVKWLPFTYLIFPFSCCSCVKFCTFSEDTMQSCMKYSLVLKYSLLHSHPHHIPRAPLSEPHWLILQSTLSQGKSPKGSLSPLLPRGPLSFRATLWGCTCSLVFELLVSLPMSFWRTGTNSSCLPSAWHRIGKPTSFILLFACHLPHSKIGFESW